MMGSTNMPTPISIFAGEGCCDPSSVPEGTLLILIAKGHKQVEASKQQKDCVARPGGQMLGAQGRPWLALRLSVRSELERESGKEFAKRALQKSGVS